MPSETTVLTLLLAMLGFSVAIASIAGILVSPASALFRDRPGARKAHQRVIARSGGISIIIAFVMCLLAWRIFMPTTVTFLHPALFSALIFVSICVAVIGLVDDMVVFSISNGAKFLLELVVAWVIVSMAGIGIEDISGFGVSFDLGWWAVPVSMLWIVGVTNALNLTDGIDGLAGTVTIVIVGCIAVLAAQSGAAEICMLCGIVAGAAAGFLLFNRSPARVFLGDTGSLFLGMFIGIMSIYLLQLPATGSTTVMLPLLVGIPLLDVAAAMGRRYARRVQEGHPWHTAFSAMFKPDNEHMHHRLIQRGMTHNQAVLVLALFSATISVTSIVVVRASSVWTAVVLAYLLAAAFIILNMLDFFDGPFAWFRRVRDSRLAPTPVAVIGLLDVDEVLAHALLNYDQTKFAFRPIDPSPVYGSWGSFDAFVTGNRNPQNLQSDWERAQQVSGAEGRPVMIVTESRGTPYSAPSLFTPHDRHARPMIVFVKKPVYVPVLLKRLEAVLKSKRHARSMGILLRETRKISLALIHHE